jgi:hypothetical protein
MELTTAGQPGTATAAAAAGGICITACILSDCLQLDGAAAVSGTHNLYRTTYLRLHNKFDVRRSCNPRVVFPVTGVFPSMISQCLTACILCYCFQVDGAAAVSGTGDLNFEAGGLRMIGTLLNSGGITQCRVSPMISSLMGFAAG